MVAPMDIQVTEEARVVLRRSLELGALDLASAGIRLRAARGLGGGVDVQVELAEGPGDDESVVTSGDVRIFVDPAVGDAYPRGAVLALEPQHDVVVVRPVASEP
jgi:Fe-S cluster assembly iron-binding protein IscA